MSPRLFGGRTANRQLKANDSGKPGGNGPETGLHDVRTVARRFDVCDKTVRRLITSGKLKACRVGRQIRVDEAEIVRFLQNNPV